MNQYVDFTKQSPVILSLCPGIRGIERGLERIFREVRACAYVEIEAFIVENLLAAMEAGVVAPAPIWTNLKTFNPEPFRDRIDGIIGGYPCQPFSVAGARQGTDDPRHLWPFIREHVRVIRPGWCFFENVAGHLTLGFDIVKGELEEMGYFVEAGIYSAEEVGAPHRRERLFILAVKMDNSSSDRLQSEYEICARGNGTEYASEELEHSESRRDGRVRNQIGEREGCRATGRSSISRSAEELADTSKQGFPKSGFTREWELPTQGGERVDDRLEQQSIELADTNHNGSITPENKQSDTERGGGNKTGTIEFLESEGCSSVRRDEELADARLLGQTKRQEQTAGTEQCSPELADTSIPRNEIGVSGQRQWQERLSGISNNNSVEHRFPAGQGAYQHPWEEPRTVESSVEYTINGYNFTEDLHRAIGNSVVEQTAELAFRDLWRKASEWYDFVIGR